MKKNTITLIVSLAALALSIINLQKLKRMENNQERLERLLGELDLATTEVANDLELLSAQIKAGEVTRASLDKLDQTITRLKELGKINDVSTTTTKAPDEDVTTTTTAAPEEVTTTTTQAPQEDPTTTTTVAPDGNGN